MTIVYDRPMTKTSRTPAPNQEEGHARTPQGRGARARALSRAGLGTFEHPACSDVSVEDISFRDACDRNDNTFTLDYELDAHDLSVYEMRARSLSAQECTE